MYVITFKKKVNGKVVDEGHENMLTDVFVSDVVKQAIERGFTDVSVEKVG
jgi:hypothetical protein